MNYRSTRDNKVSVSAAQAITRGISADGGLFVPETLPFFDLSRIEGMLEMDYRARACEILREFLTDFTAEEIRGSVEGAYGSQWASGKITPLSRLSPDIYMLELWHGPTCAFKDVALQLLPRLMVRSAEKTVPGLCIDILVATSGDTGKAALEGFADVPGTSVTVFYPEHGVSLVQKLQMTTQRGGNVGVCGVFGNFDDTQSAVKGIFADDEIRRILVAKKRMLSSANSINWGRLVPQIVYYFDAYCSMVASEEIELGGKVNVTVPTGNFGNILAAYYAKRMGLPIGKLICASNANKVLTDFIATGVYDRRREFYATSSPSMDILISSNLERLLHELSGADDAAVGEMMGALSRDGFYHAPKSVTGRLGQDFCGGFCGEEGTFAAISEVFRDYSYLMDPHTAVALSVYREYRASSGDDAKTIIASTASPFKFAGSVLEAITGKPGGEDEFEMIKRLEEISGQQAPAQIRELSGRPVRFDKTCGREDIFTAAKELLGI